MLSLFVVQVFAGVAVLAAVAGFALSHSLRRPQIPRAPRVVAKREPARWTEAVWVGGSLLATILWPLGVLLAPSDAYDWPEVPSIPGTEYLQLLGFVVAFVGGALFVRSVQTLGKHMTVAIQVQEGHRLVQSGPYRYIRHPIYTAILVSGFSNALLYLSLPLALVTLLLVGIALYRVRLEEGLLGSSEGFGPEYSAYVARTGRFLPRLRRKP
jgi:protein-S-isoprenylcysteine O-methyltransferase Ste14